MGSGLDHDTLDLVIEAIGEFAAGELPDTLLLELDHADARDPLAMPVSQTAPSPLERAEPIHSWLAQPLTGAGGTDVVRARDASQDAPRDGARRP